MKYRKITAVILAVATAICAAGCNGNDNSGTSSSGDVTSSGSGDSSMTTTSGGNSGTAQAQFTFSQVAMGGGGFVSGVFATSEQGLYIMPVQTSAAHTVIIRILRSGNPCRTISAKKTMVCLV